MDFLGFLVQLDPRLQELIALGVTVVVSFLFLQIANVLPWLAEYLGQYKTGIVVWLTGVVVQLVQAQLDRIPESWDSIVALVMQLIIEVIMVLVGFALYRRAKIKGYQAL